MPTCRFTRITNIFVKRAQGLSHLISERAVPAKQHCLDNILNLEGSYAKGADSSILASLVLDKAQKRSTI